MRIGIFGGTFNPIHWGHLNFCRQCNDLYRFDQLLLMPTNLPPHKAAADLASNEDRIAMLRLAAEEEPFLTVSDLEYRLGGKSYTVETLRALRRELPEGEFTLLMGSDMLRTFHHWYCSDEILSLARIVAGARHPAEEEELLTLRQNFGSRAERIEIARIHVTEISSTRVREAVRRGEPLEALLPASVADYIKSRRLYLTEGSGSPES